MKLASRKREMPQLNLSPLIDVVFILLIFVVLVARFIDQERIDVNVPAAEAGRPAEVEALYVTINLEGNIEIEGREIAKDKLPYVLEAARSRYGRAVLVADQTVPLQQAVDVISTAKLAGFDGVALATRPPSQ